MNDFARAVECGEAFRVWCRGGYCVFDDDICPPAKAEIKDFHSRGQIPKAQKKKPMAIKRTQIGCGI